MSKITFREFLISENNFNCICFLCNLVFLNSEDQTQQCHNLIRVRVEKEIKHKMGSRKKPAKIELEEDDAAIGSTSSIAAISDDDEEANKDLSIEIIHKALLNRATNPQNAAALIASTLIAPSKVHSEENKLRIKKKKKKKLESDIETVNVSGLLG